MAAGRRGLTGADAAVRLRDALVEFRSFLEELDARYARLRSVNAGLPVGVQIERAAAKLLPMIVEHTSAEDMWYSTFERVVTWFVEPWFDDPSLAKARVLDAIGGRFQSWMAPDEASAAEVLRRLSGIGEQAQGEGVRDALSTWLGVRARLAWRRERVFTPGPVRRDGHLAYIERTEARRDPERAARMQEALVFVRAAPRLDLEMLRAAQSIVLGRAVTLRQGPAFAKGGRERYDVLPRMAERFEACLAEARSSSPHAISRAASTSCDEAGARAFELVIDHLAGDTADL